MKSTSKQKTLWVLIFLSVIVHGGLLYIAHHRTGAVDGYAFNSLDAKEYYQIASNVVDHGVFSQSESPPLKPDTWRTPGYPLFLALLMLIVGKSTVALVVVHQILSILNVWLLFRVTQCYMSSRRGLIACLIFLVEPYHLYYSLWLMATTWFVTLLLLTWLVWLRYQNQSKGKSNSKKSAKLKNGILLGLLCGFMVLVRPVAVLIPFVVFVGMVIQLVRHPEGTRSSGKTMIAPVVYAMICIVVISGWMIRNKQVAGRFALSDQSGVVLAYFKATEAVLWREGNSAERYVQTSLDSGKRDEPHFVWDEIDERLRNQMTGLSDDQRNEIHWSNLAQGNQTSLNSFVMSDELKQIGWSLIFDSPVSSIACGLLRCGSILTFPLNIAIWPPDGIEIQRLRSWAVGVAYLVLTLAVCFRLYRHGGISKRHGGLMVGVYFPLACTVALLVMTTPQIDPRFRVPMIPMLIVLAMMPVRQAKK